MAIHEIRGLHHITSMAGDARWNNAFFTGPLGLRRVKKTVNFDAPDIYHLYYGDAQGTPGSVMTYFPFPGMARGRKGAGEVGLTGFGIPKGALGFWERRLGGSGVKGMKRGEVFGEARLSFAGPDGDEFALVECDDVRAPWLGGGIPEEAAISGFHSAVLRLSGDAAAAMAELLSFMGYEKTESSGAYVRHRLPRERDNGSGIVDIETVGQAEMARQGAGSVHHIAFAVEDRAAQLAVREKLLDTGYRVTPVIDRNYFWAIYFRTPGGVLFEIATDEPGFARDEAPESLGESLKLPAQHEHLRAFLTQSLPALEG